MVALYAEVVTGDGVELFMHCYVLQSSKIVPHNLDN